MDSAAKRNGEIDLCRLGFSLLIVLNHFNSYFPQGIMPQGWIGDEFFFVLAGFLMANHVYRHIPARLTDCEETASETWRFILGKVRGFYRYYLAGIFVQLIVRYILIRHMSVAEIANAFLMSIPNFTLTFMGLVGMDSLGLYVGNTWYLSAMLIAMFILYPILLRGRSFATKIIFPMIAVFTLAIMNKNAEVTSWKEWSGLIYWGILRAGSQIALGASMFELAEWIKKRSEAAPVSPWMKVIYTLAKCACLAVMIVFAAGYIKKSYTIHIVLFCALFVLLSFSGLSYTIPGNRFTSYCGKIALPIFIFHGIVRHSCNDYFTNKEITLPAYFAMVCAAILLSVLMMYLTDWTVSLIRKRKAASK